MEWFEALIARRQRQMCIRDRIDRVFAGQQ